MQDIREIFQNRTVLADGAMGTYFLAQFGPVVDACELANIRQPELVRQVHEAYLAAGARLIRTNTFAAIPATEAPLFAGLAEIIRSGYRLATACAANQPDVLVAADIGPGFGLEPGEAQIAYDIIIRSFVTEGARLFMLETFADPDEVLMIARMIRRLQPQAFIIASFALSADGLTRKGVSLQRLAAQIDASPDIDIFGLNCGVGPTHLRKLVEQLNDLHKPLSILPNSGYPRLDHLRSVYSSSADYFAMATVEMLRPNVRLVGGCCGTTPAHIRAVGDLLAIRQNQAGQNGQIPALGNVDGKTAADGPSAPASGPSAYTLPMVPVAADTQHRLSLASQLWADNRFTDKIRQNQFTIVCELDPPRHSDLQDLIIAARSLAAAGLDAITLADSPLARVKMDPVICAARLQREAGLPVMPHLACRDRNVNALRSLLLGAHSEGIRQVLVITGDGIPESDRGFIKPVFNLNSIGLLEQIAQMNQDVFAAAPLMAGAALDLGVSRPDVELKRMLRKMDQGAVYALTQPIYEPAGLELLAEVRSRGLKVLLGLLPLVSYRNARFLAEEVPGIRIPAEIVARFKPEQGREEAAAIGVAVCAEVARAMRPHVDGFYLIAPFNRAELAIELYRSIQSLA